MSEKKDRSGPKGEKVVSESKAIAERIIKSLEKGMSDRPPRKRRIGEPTLMDHIEAMHRALADSKDDFLVYVRTHFPNVCKEMEKILNSKGEEALLLSLRVIESGYRAYPPQ